MSLAFFGDATRLKRGTTVTCRCCPPSLFLRKRQLIGQRVGGVLLGFDRGKVALRGR